MCCYGGRIKDVQDDFLMEWERNTIQLLHAHHWKKRKEGSKIAGYKGIKKTNQPYIVSGVFHETNKSQYYICKKTFKLFFNIGTHTLQCIETEIMSQPSISRVVMLVMLRLVMRFGYRW